ncbi:unnamed protein product [Cunninghamella echinulata]
MIKGKKKNNKNEMNKKEEPTSSMHCSSNDINIKQESVDDSHLLITEDLPSATATTQPSSYFTLHQFTSDQANNQNVELNDIFNCFNDNNNSNNIESCQSTPLEYVSLPPNNNPHTHNNNHNHNNINNNHNNNNINSNTNLIPHLYQQDYSFMSLSVPTSPTDHIQMATNNTAMYVSSSSSTMAPPPPSYNGVLRNKLINDQLSKSYSSSLSASAITTATPPPLSTSSSSTSTSSQLISPMIDDYSNRTLNVTNNNSNVSNSMESLSTSSLSSSSPSSHVFPVSAPTTPPQQQHSSFYDNDKPICTNCGATSTPLWRRSSEDELLCNACGLYQKLHNAPRPKSLKPHNSRKETKEEDAIQLVCSNCSTTTTPLWRRDDEGSPLCNACGLYLKLHHEKRPLSMKTDIIKKRQRYENKDSNHHHNHHSHHQHRHTKINKKQKSVPTSPTITEEKLMISPMAALFPFGTSTNTTATSSSSSTNTPLESPHQQPTLNFFSAHSSSPSSPSSDFIHIPSSSSIQSTSIHDFQHHLALQSYHHQQQQQQPSTFNYF